MFNGENHISAENYIQDFECLIDNFEAIHEDIGLRTFCKTLYGDARMWFKHLEVESIESWDDFFDACLIYWGENKSYD